MTEDGEAAKDAELFAARYELLELLGRGTSGEVWRARDTRRGHLVALKVLHDVEPEAAWHEATRLTELKFSPNILGVNNADLAVDVPYLDTDLAELGTAKDACEPNGLPVGRAIQIIRGALRGLQLCHDHRLLHRDVKPANVFLKANGDSQLGDFGLTMIMDEQDSAKVGGDPDVRAPETMKGARHTVVADVYSAGVTLYAMLTGSLPFSITTAGGFQPHKENVLAGMPDVRDVAPHVSTALAKVVRKATAIRPADRFQSAAEFDAALGRLPTLTHEFSRGDAHPGHARCWTVTRLRDGHVVDVCEAVNGRVSTVTARHASSGNKVSGLGGSANGAARSAVLLRRTFASFLTT